MHELDGGGEGAVLGGRVTVLTDGYAPGFGDLGGYLGARQYAAMAWLGSLRQIDFYHFDAVLTRPSGKNLLRKISNRARQDSKTGRAHVRSPVTKAHIEYVTF